MSTPFEVARVLVDLCRQGKFDQAMEQTYAQDIVSLEGFDMGPMPRQATGLDAVRAKSKWWNENHTVHSVKVSDPFASAEKFAVTFDMDVTDKTTGKRIQMTEVAVYTVRDGKIVHEEFLYGGM